MPSESNFSCFGKPALLSSTNVRARFHAFRFVFCESYRNQTSLNGSWRKYRHEKWSYME